MASFQTKIVLKGHKREKITIVVSFGFVPTRRVIENSKKRAKKFKKKKKTIMASFQVKIG